MPTLSDTQMIINSPTRALSRPDRMVLPLPEEPSRAVPPPRSSDSLIAKSLLQEVDANVTQRRSRLARDRRWAWCHSRRRPTPPTPPWMAAENGSKPTVAPQRPAKAKKAKVGAKGQPKAKKATQAATAPAQAKSREGTKQAQLIAMLRRAKGATITEIAETFGWQHHTVRGALAGALKRKLGLDIQSEKDERRGRVYRITD